MNCFPRWTLGLILGSIAWSGIAPPATAWADGVPAEPAGGLTKLAAFGLRGCGGGGGGDAGGVGGSVTAQMSLTASATGLTSVSLVWSAASLVSEYRVYLNGTYSGTTYPPDTSATLPA